MPMRAPSSLSSPRLKRLRTGWRRTLAGGSMQWQRASSGFAETLSWLWRMPTPDVQDRSMEEISSSVSIMDTYHYFPDWGLLCLGEVLRVPDFQGGDACTRKNWNGLPGNGPMGCAASMTPSAEKWSGSLPMGIPSHRSAWQPR